MIYFCPHENDEVLDLEISYLSAYRALMYLSNYTRSDMTFTTNLLVRFSPSPT